MIEEYVSNAVPVGSHTLTEQYDLGVSSATIRNELSVLEEAGYVTQPHTSSGRIPTDAGYREFVDELIAAGKIQDTSATEQLTRKLRTHADRLDALMRQVSEELAHFTNCLSIVGLGEGDMSTERLACKESIGLSSLMRKPEFQESSSLLPIMEILEDDTVYFRVYSEASASTDGFSICIGSENKDGSLVSASVVAGVYGHGGNRGVVAVIGPRRMDYENVIQAVRVAQQILDQRS